MRDFGIINGVEETSLKEAFPGLYNIAIAKEAIVVDNMDFTGGTIQWNVSFFRLAHDWELEVLASFYLCCILVG
jgi:hypothetical protein